MRPLSRGAGNVWCRFGRPRRSFSGRSSNRVEAGTDWKPSSVVMSVDGYSSRVC